MCKFESLFFSEDSYVIRCTTCGHYQLAFLSTLLTLDAHEFDTLCKVAQFKCLEDHSSFSEHSKCVIISTPFYGQCMLLTKAEAHNLNNMLQEADNEAKAQSLLQLFY